MIFDFILFFFNISLIFSKSDGFLISWGKSFIGAPSMSDPTLIWSSPQIFNKFLKCGKISEIKTSFLDVINLLYKTIPITPPRSEIFFNCLFVRFLSCLLIFLQFEWLAIGINLVSFIAVSYTHLTLPTTVFV